MSIEQNFSNHDINKEKYRREFTELGIIKDVLKKNGLDVIERYTDEMWEDSFKNDQACPIVEDGMQGIRVERDYEGGLVVWFTNGFADRDNHIRQKVTKELKEAGINI